MAGGVDKRNFICEPLEDKVGFRELHQRINPSGNKIVASITVTPGCVDRQLLPAKTFSLVLQRFPYIFTRISRFCGTVKWLSIPPPSSFTEMSDTMVPIL